MNLELLKFKIMGDERGSLIALEENMEVPFDIKRVFCIFDTKDGVERGVHAHYKTQQVIIAVSGFCKVELDDGKQKHVFNLNRKEIGIFQDKLIWGKMYDFSSDCVLMVLADQLYDPDDYITDYDEFLEYISTTNPH